MLGRKVRNSSWGFSVRNTNSGRRVCNSTSGLSGSGGYVNNISLTVRNSVPRRTEGRSISTRKSWRVSICLSFGSSVKMSEMSSVAF